MAKKVGKYYLCGYCGKPFSDPIKADSHKEEAHDLIYIALDRTDLNRLIQFIHFKNDELLTPSLVNNLRKYLKGNNVKINDF